MRKLKASPPLNTLVASAISRGGLIASDQEILAFQHEAPLEIMRQENDMIYDPYNQLNEQEDLTGIDVSKLDPGVRIIVETRNSIYKIYIDEGKMFVEGGDYIQGRQEAVMTGSTFGGTLMKMGWIGYQMKMEFYMSEDKKVLSTSPVQAALVQGDGWEYEMEWPGG